MDFLGTDVGEIKMGYPIQDNAPQITYQGRTFAVGAFVNPTIVGNFFNIGVYEQKPDGWNLYHLEAFSVDQNEVLRLVRSAGGIRAFMQLYISQLNAILATLFASTPVPGVEPTTNEEAWAAITSYINSMHLVVVNGAIVLQ